MADFPQTRVSLILRLADASNVLAWQEFSEVYAPALLALSKRKGLQQADAEDVTQEILFGVARAVQKFEPDNDRARFRTWLSRIAQNRIADFFAKRANHPQPKSFDVQLHSMPETDAPQSALNQELRRSIFRHAAKRVASRVTALTWQAFE